MFYFSDALVTHHGQNQQGARSLFHLTTCNPSFRARTQGRNLEAETEAEAMEILCFLAWSPQLALPAFFIGSRATNLRVAPPTVAWALLHQSSKKRKWPTGLPKGQPGGSIFLIDVPSSKMSPSFVKSFSPGSLHSSCTRAILRGKHFCQSCLLPESQRRTELGLGQDPPWCALPSCPHSLGVMHKRRRSP